MPTTNNCPFHRTCTTYNRLSNILPVPKDRACCYNCKSEVYYLDQRTGLIRTECTLPRHTNIYDETTREIAACPDFCRRSAHDVLSNPAMKGNDYESCSD